MARSLPGHSPPPSVQTGADKNSDQQLMLPKSSADSSTTCKCHVPLTLVPVIPINTDSGSTGLKEPMKGGFPPLMLMVASSSKVVRRSAQLPPKLSPDPPTLAAKVLVMPAGEI